MIFRHNPSRSEEKAGTELAVKSKPAWATSAGVAGALQERRRQLEVENAQLRLQVQVLRELLHDE